MLNLNSLNPQQRQAVETIHGPVLILAGAGTGKTRVITHRIAHMVNRGISPGNILGVTFTNKAAREMQERVGKLLRREKGEGRREKENAPTICTFHSLCVRILRQHIEKLGYKRNFVIYDEADQLSAVKKILSHISSNGEKADAGLVLASLSRWKNGGEHGAGFSDASVRAMAEHIRDRYDLALRACNAVDFDDLILLTLRLFADHPAALESCRAKYRYVMVDEYQDTNTPQFKLVQALTQKHRNLCVVGDDDQSIYGWRGAEISNLLDMEKHFPEVKVIKLEQNYRSTNTILTAANAIIKQNARRRAKQLWSQKGQGEKITLYTFKDDEEEARNIVALIDYARMARRAAWAEQAILFRTNAQSRPLETALRQAGVRYHLIGGQSFFDRREIRDFLAYLKVLVNPDDDVSLLRIANVPARGLSEPTMERLLAESHKRNCSVFGVMKNADAVAAFQGRAGAAIRSFVELVERTRTELGSKLNWGNNFLQEIGYFDEVRRAEKTAEAGENRIRNLQEFSATLDDAGAACSIVGLEAFLEKISLDNEREEKEDEGPREAVTLITMHSCKGLEFPHVYIVGMEDGLLPHARSKQEGTLDEERRLFYVALTRARETLSISHCAGRKKYGTVTPRKPSPFLAELPAELVEHAAEKGRQPVAAESGRNLFAAMREAAV